MHLTPFFMSMYTAVKNTGVPMEGESDVLRIIRLLPAREVDPQYVILTVEQLAKRNKFPMTITLDTDHAILAKQVGKLISRVARHHAQTCPSCSLPYSTMSMAVFTVTNYLVSEESHGTETAFSHILAVVLPENDCRSADRTSLRQRIHDWKISDGIH